MLFQGLAFWCLLVSDHRYFVTALETCQTAWFDDGDFSSQGDSERLGDLKRNHQTRICSNPVDMEAQTLSGIKSQDTKNTFNVNSASEGFVCLNSEQKQRECYDYKVKFTCTGQFCSECRTRWFDHDDPQGNGDYELLSDLLLSYPKVICIQPIAIEVQTVSGKPASNTSDVFLTYDATYGFACVNAQQGHKDCDDYKVRFTCPTEFCQGFVSISNIRLVPQECRTRWLSSDNSSAVGDIESITHLLKAFPGQVCREPVSIEAKTTKGVPAKHTGDKFLSYNVEFGLVCINEDQVGGQCEDYQVMLTCPSDFCQGCRTRWFDLDNPTLQGDFETLLHIQMLYPTEICSQPVGIEAMTVSGVPALKAGDVFQIYDAAQGFTCVNAQQPGGKRCQDYKVRFTCPQSFCPV
ncbi:uncharacterized protein LOC143012894 [Genypterus blacodes]|uniref:uncharacterized protein LOC143012894 n=1 Tax=Genypterus blacodes TaxID=154954 RepID=UPI003F773711